MPSLISGRAAEGKAKVSVAIGRIDASPAEPGAGPPRALASPRNVGGGLQLTGRRDDRSHQLSNAVSSSLEEPGAVAVGEQDVLKTSLERHNLCTSS
jgi:hypothetical protein